MQKGFFKSLPAFKFHLLEKFSNEITHGVFSRIGGVSKKPYDSLNVRFDIEDKFENVKKNRKIICDALNIPIKNLVSGDQTHSKNVRFIDKFSKDEIADTDGFITNISGLTLMIQVADCQAILMFDPVHKVVAAVHAGWKGLTKNISEETLRLMKKLGCDPKNILVGIGPSLGPCCAFFSNPEKELPKSFHQFIDRKKRVDLWRFSVEQLKTLGILAEKIELARVCTMCGTGNKFFSFRRERGITGRFGALIFLN